LRAKAEPTTPKPNLNRNLNLNLTSGSKADRLELLKQQTSACTLCPHLARSRTQVVFGVGDPAAKLMFVGEAPGADEDQQGEPFVGKAGQLLTKMIVTMELTREQVYIANVLKCRPDMPPNTSGNRKPTRDEMATCLPYLQAQISIIAPQVIVALGATAVEGLLGPQKNTISRLRGSWLELGGVPVRPTFHPSYLQRNQDLSLKRLVWEDLLAVMERLSLPISKKQRHFFLKP
jgi:DNA polymerase